MATAKAVETKYLNCKLSCHGGTEFLKKIISQQLCRRQTNRVCAPKKFLLNMPLKCQQLRKSKVYLHDKHGIASQNIISFSSSVQAVIPITKFNHVIASTHLILSTTTKK